VAEDLKLDAGRVGSKGVLNLIMWLSLV
jgi:hypothetical protein